MPIPTKEIRNVVVLSHSGDGKTTLIENLLFKSGAISKKGSVDLGTTVSDFNDDEKERRHSINLSAAFYEKDGVKVNLLDAPGFLDYMGDIVAGVSAADAAILIIDAVGGVKVGTSKFWKLTQERKMPVLIVINKMDKENANFFKTLESVQKSLSKNCVAICYPNGSVSSFSGVVNLLTKKGIDTLSGDEKETATGLANDLMEGVAESDDALLEKYLEKGTLTPDEITKALKAGVVSGKIIPVIPALPEKGIGLDDIMEVIQKYFPSPLDVAPPELDVPVNGGELQTVNVEPKEEAAFSAQVFKTISDPYAGQISIFRVRSGVVKSNQLVMNSSKGAEEKLGQLFFLRGKEQVHTDSAVAGDIVAAAKLKGTDTDNTLCDVKKMVKFKKINFPEPAVSFSIKPKSRSDEDKISGVLVKLIAEDPAFKMLRDVQTHELVISGMGDLHLKTMINRMKNRYGVDVEIGTPKVAYKETITSNGDAQYRHKKQSGGAGQFAEVWMKIEPLPRGEGFQFVDEVVGGAIPRQFVGSCEKGVKNALGEGTVAGFPVVDVRVIVYDGKTHPVDSKDIAFQIAAAHAFRQACEKAKPVLLEPVMHVELTVPEENMGDVTGSLSSRRGKVLGMGSEGGMQILTAEIPLEEMYKYANELKSITAGRATYTMSFAHYEVVPPNIAQKVVAENKKVHHHQKEE